MAGDKPLDPNASATSVFFEIFSKLPTASRRSTETPDFVAGFLDSIGRRNNDDAAYLDDCVDLPFILFDTDPPWPRLSLSDFPSLLRADFMSAVEGEGTAMGAMTLVAAVVFSFRRSPFGSGGGAKLR